MKALSTNILQSKDPLERYLGAPPSHRDPSRGITLRVFHNRTSDYTLDGYSPYPHPVCPLSSALLRSLDFAAPPLSAGAATKQRTCQPIGATPSDRPSDMSPPRRVCPLADPPRKDEVHTLRREAESSPPKYVRSRRGVVGCAESSFQRAHLEGEHTVTTPT